MQDICGASLSEVYSLRLHVSIAIHVATSETVDRVSKLKNESMRIISNALFFGRASLGMKKATTSVAVAALFFCYGYRFPDTVFLRYYGT